MKNVFISPEIKSTLWVSAEKDLLLASIDYPFLFLNKTVHGMPLLKSTVDFFDRYDVELWYTVSAQTLKKFVSGEISFFQFASSAIGGQYMTVPISKENADAEDLPEIKTYTTTTLPYDYLPHIDAEMPPSELLNVSKAKKMFGLDAVKPVYEWQNALEEVGGGLQSSVINLHYKEGPKVGFGKMPTKLLGESLLQFDKVLGALADKIEFPDKNGKTVKLIPNSEILTTQAASYNVFIQPLAKDGFEQQEELYVGLSRQLIGKLFLLMEISEKKDSLENGFDDFGVEPFFFYKKFVSLLKKAGVEIDVCAAPDFKDRANYRKNSYGQGALQRVLDVYDSFETQDSEDFEVVGHFVAVNLNNRYFQLEENETLKKYSGHFSKDLQESGTLFQINLNHLFKASIHRKRIRKIAEEHEQIADTMTALMDFKPGLRKISK